MDNKMKICVIGLGSMGKRRIRDLLALGIEKIVGMDLNPERCTEASRLFGIETLPCPEETLFEDYDAVVISTPPDMHAVYGKLAANAGKPFFMEANVVQDGLLELASLCKTQKILAAPSCTMRFHPSIKLLKQLVEQISPQAIAAFSYVSGQYLPDWHPYEDYRHFYVAKKETGACREIVPFELNWLTWLFGEVTQVNAIKAKRTKLQVDIDDIYVLTLAFSSGVVGSLEVNVISRIPERYFRAIGEGVHIIWNWMDQEVKIYNAATESWKVHPETAGFKKYNLEEMYYEEMQAFVNALTGKGEYDFNLEEEQKILQTVYRSDQVSGETKSRR
jgi:predicted dehydrogenase